ncbi:MAG TPA: glycosyltransferase family 39 protein [Spirochaetota bacterium]|nr:glycosyltransferase family 39 protein [Spirochaetota bacterium]HNT11493.1 glycosyltransferase family 39 protein [Spirochaetota bacterium]
MDITKNRLYAVVGAIVLFKLILAYAFPIWPDEGYYLTWTRNIDTGFYCHPPMVGWLMYVMSFISRDIFFHRLIAIFVSTAAGFVIFAVARDITRDEKKAALASLVYFLSPANVFFIVLTNDAPLFLFTLLCVVCFYYAVARDRIIFSMLAGVFMGLAFLCKYFAVLLFLSMVVYLAFNRNRRTLTHCLVAGIAALPIASINLYYNYMNCWNNVMVQWFNRTGDKSFSALYFIGYVFGQLYWLTPWGLYYLVRERGGVAAFFAERTRLVFALALLAPLAFMALIGLKAASLHWTLPFFSVLPIVLLGLQSESLKRIVVGNAIFVSAHALVIVVLLLLPLSLFKDFRYYTDFVLYKKGDLICAELAPYRGKYVFGTIGYTVSSTLDYYCGEYFLIFNSLSKWGRNDDKVTDFRKLDGKNILVVSPKIETADEYRHLFERVEVRYVDVLEGRFSFIVGDGFKYAAYRDTTLRKALDKLYNVPTWLPCGSCYFFDRYFPERKY